MRTDGVGQLSASSSAAALSVLHLQPLNATHDDFTIAQGLLTRPHIPQMRRIPRRNSSYAATTSSPAKMSLDVMDTNGQVWMRQPQVLPLANTRSRKVLTSSNTWTDSSAELLLDSDEPVDRSDRAMFVQEYNLLARKHGIRSIMPDISKTPNLNVTDDSAKPESWFSRKILRRSSSIQSVKQKPDRPLRHQRSISDLSLRLKSKREKLKDKNLQDLVRLCGASFLYLPTEYAAGSLSLPTCFRATAQHLAQHGTETRGLFRIPGSHNIVSELYNHYSYNDEHGEVIAGTVRCPTLPDHIKCDVHDVASAFKKFLAGLPGGILGSLTLFDAFVSIQNQIDADPELNRTKQSKVRARLIALAVLTLSSHYRRDLICAVFGLLCMFGRAAETCQREDYRGRPLPTSDLMGYGPLGVVFGPILVGDLLDEYTIRLANPTGGLVLLPVSPPKSRKERRRKSSKAREEGNVFNAHVDKINIANKITEMLITHWRDVVRHLRNLTSLKHSGSLQTLAAYSTKHLSLRPSASESFAMRRPADWDNLRSPYRHRDRSVSPTLNRHSGSSSGLRHTNDLTVNKQRTKPRPLATRRLTGARSLNVLSPTIEERSKEELQKFSSQLTSQKFQPSSAPDSRFNHSPAESLAKSRVANQDQLASPNSSDTESDPPDGATSFSSSRKHTSDSIRQKIRFIEARASSKKDSIYTDTPELSKHRPQSQSIENLRSNEAGENDSSISTLNSPNSSYSRREHKNTSARSHSSGPRKTKLTEDIPRHLNFLLPDQNFEVVASRSSRGPDGDPTLFLSQLKGSEPAFAESTRSNSLRKMPPSPAGEPNFQKSLMDFNVSSKGPLPAISREDGLTSSAAIGDFIDFNFSNTDPLFHNEKLSGKVDHQKACTMELCPNTDIKNTNSSEVLVPAETTECSDKSPTTSRLAVAGSSNGISVLLAKFNNPDSPIFPNPSGSAKSLSKSTHPSDSPAKSLSKSEMRSFLQPPKDRLVAPYTSNPPTLTRSHMSAKSEKTSRSSRKVLPAYTAPTVDTKIQPMQPLALASKQLWPESATDSTLLRANPETESHKLSPSTVNSAIQNDIYPQRAKSPSARSETPKSKLPVRSSRFTSERSLFDKRKNDDSHASTNLSTTCSQVTSPSVDQAPTIRAKSGIIRRFQSGRLQTYDGSSQITSRARSAPSDSPSWLSKSESSVRSAAESVTPTYRSREDCYSVPHVTSSRVSSPPARSNSLLYNQVQTLQNQLSAKCDEIRQLRQRLECRSKSDVMSLTEQLREAQRDIQVWRGRAEESEQRLKDFASHTSRSSCSHISEPDSMCQGDMTEWSTDTSLDADGVARIVHRPLRGLLDAGRSTGGWYSENSTDTIIRELREAAITGSEYSNWVETTNGAL